MRRVAAVVLAAALLSSCRTARPVGAPVEPLTATTADQAIEQLRERYASFRGMRSLMRVRATVNGKTQSFRAQLHVQDERHMELTAYTPVGTTALKMKAEGDRITTDPPVAPDAFDFLRDAELTPAETAMLLLGLPPRDGMRIDYAPGGVASASLGAMTVQFEPPSFPAQRVIITSGADRIEITHDEVVREN
ncbi:MAG TPA: DUF3261 domain-containing protein [Thermoanaerobaculia bacterium]|nr:DUF3261 domain-containing protein [Thermoanaerobaculia bacterium]